MAYEILIAPNKLDDGELLTDGAATLLTAIMRVSEDGVDRVVTDNQGLLWYVEADTKVDPDTDPYYPAIVHRRR